MSLWIVLLLTVLGADQKSPQSEFDALKKEYDSAIDTYRNAYSNAKTDEERETASKKQPKRQDYIPGFFQIVEAHPDDPAAIDALVWIATEDMFWTDGEKAMKILAAKHAGSPQVAIYASRSSRYGGPFPPYEDLLRATEQYEHKRDVQAAIRLTLGLYLKMTKETADGIQVMMSTERKGWVSGTDLENMNRWKENGFEKRSAELEGIFESIVADYGDVKLKDTFPERPAEIARQQLFELRNLQIGMVAPNIESTDVDGTAINLNDYRGKVVLLDFGSHRMCGICVALYPDLRDLVARYQDQPFQMIGINTGDKVEKLKELTRSKQVTWKLIWDGNGYQGPITSRWAIDSMPMFYLIDHKGVIRNKGYFNFYEAMPEMIERLMSEIKTGQDAKEE